MAAKIVDKPSKRREISQKALPLLAERGYAGASIREIALAAGISKGGFYDYFADKDDLLSEIAELLFSAWEEAARQAMASLSRPRDILMELTRMALSMGTENRQMFLLYIDLWRSGVSEGGAHPVIKRLKECIHQTQQGVAALLKEGRDSGTVRASVDAGAMAFAWVALVDGLCLHHLLNPETASREQALQAAAALLEGLE